MLDNDHDQISDHFDTLQQPENDIEDKSFYDSFHNELERIDSINDPAKIVKDIKKIKDNKSDINNNNDILNFEQTEQRNEDNLETKVEENADNEVEDVTASKARAELVEWLDWVTRKLDFVYNYEQPHEELPDLGKLRLFI